MSSRSAAVIFWSNIELFLILELMSRFYFYTLMIVCSVFPTLLAYATSDEAGMPWWVIFIICLIIIVGNLFICNGFLSTFSIAQSSIFVFYSLDRQLHKYGVSNTDAPPEIKDLIENAVGDDLANLTYVERAKATRKDMAEKEPLLGN